MNKLSITLMVVFLFIFLFAGCGAPALENAQIPEGAWEFDCMYYTVKFPVTTIIIEDRIEVLYPRKKIEDLSEKQRLMSMEFDNGYDNGDCSVEIGGINNSQDLVELETSYENRGFTKATFGGYKCWTKWDYTEYKLLDKIYSSTSKSIYIHHNGLFIDMEFNMQGRVSVKDFNENILLTTVEQTFKIKNPTKE